VKVLIPAAGLGTRLRPHTHHRPKPLIPLAGKTVLGHALDRVAGLEVSELIFVVGHLGDQMRDHVAAHYSVATRYVVQEELLGQAHAIALARDFIDGPLLILFVDTIFEADLSGLADVAADGVIFYQEVEDPRRFGVITVDSSGHVATFVEKPQEPTSNRAVVGLYYLKRGEDLIAAIDELMARNIQTKGGVLSGRRPSDRDRQRRPARGVAGGGVGGLRHRAGSASHESVYLGASWRASSPHPWAVT